MPKEKINCAKCGKEMEYVEPCPHCGRSFGYYFCPNCMETKEE